MRKFALYENFPLYGTCMCIGHVPRTSLVLTCCYFLARCDESVEEHESSTEAAATPEDHDGV